MKPKVLTPRDVSALIHLLGDEDHWVKDQARAALREAGPRAQPLLESASISNTEREIRNEAHLLLEDIHVDVVEREWVGLQVVDEGEALEGGAFLLERIIDSRCQAGQRKALDELEEIASRAREALPSVDNIESRVAALSTFLSRGCSFQGNVEDYYDPANSFLSRVILRRTGIPISLALIYLAIARRIGIPLVGVGMPMHFLVGFRAGSTFRYLDPFYGGRSVSRNDCLALLERAGFEPADDYLQPAPVVSILERMARNLISIYEDGGRERELRLSRRFVCLLTGRDA